MWFIIAIISVFLFAVTAVVDKFLLSKSPLIPISYAFVISLLGALASVVLVIFEKGFYFPAQHFLALFIGGAGFYFAVYFMYLAVVKNEVSRVNPMINSLAPVVIYFLTMVLAVELISARKLLGAAVVISGGYLLSQVGLKKAQLHKSALVLIILAAIMFGISNTFSKMAYDQLPFLTSFIWIRWLTLLTALVFTTLIGGWSKISFKRKKQRQTPAKKKNPWPALVIGQVSGGAAVILFQYAIKLGSVTIVTALQGLQYFFLLLLTILLSKKFPQILQEAIGPAVIKKKLLYCLILAIGVILLLV
ncbi:DMT family transporter [Patescibacteria group bacterium]|nr:DMT family transporter [Patescibacteria group bacterium]